MELLLEYIYDALNKKRSVVSVFIDFRKAFDTINHKILLDKLSVYGIRGLPLQLLTSYLTGRTQCVRIGSTKSTNKIVTCGIPQGSCLGPLLFLFYVNDLPNVSEHLSSVLFADDTTVFKSGDNLSQLTRHVNEDLVKIKSWCDANRLSLNIPKTSTTLFTFSNFEAQNVLIDNIPLATVSKSNFLGICVDNKLNFSSHIQNICSKLSKSTGIFYKLKHYVPQSVLIQLYYSLIYPYLIYGNILWGSTYTTHLKPLEVMQKKIIRAITNSPYNAHTTSLFKLLKILKLHDIHTFCIAKKMFYSHEDLCFATPHSYNTRNSSDARPSFQRLTTTQQSIKYVGPKVWNSIPSNVRCISSFNKFKSELKKHLIAQY